MSTTPLGPFLLDHANRALWHGAERVAIQPKVFDCIELLASRAGKLTSTAHLRETLWPDVKVGDEAVRQTIAKARAALRSAEDRDLHIRSRKGLGYVLDVKGASPPVAARSSPPLARQRPPEPGWPFIGRQHELAQLSAALSNLAKGSGEVWLIGGEAGQGKSTLLEELARSGLDGRALWLEGHCQEGFAAGAFWPFRQLVHELLRRSESDEALAASVQRIGDYWRDATKPFRGVIGAQHRPSSSEQRLLVAQALCTQLCALATRMPLALVLEDLHWADAGSLLLLEILARHVSGCPIVVFATYRVTEASKHETLGPVLGRLAGRKGIRELRLNPLTVADLNALLSHAKPSHATQGAAESLMRLTGGNALFARVVIEQTQELDDVARTASIEERVTRFTALPHVVTDLLRALPSPCQRLLPQAAVLGSDFDLPVLAALVRESEAQLQLDLEPALRSGIIVRASQGPYRLRFRHALVRDALYDDLSSYARMDLHRRAVAVFARGPAEQRSNSTIAWHAYLAGDAFDRTETRNLCEQAGRECFEQLAFDHALVHLGRALELSGQGPTAPPRPELHLLYARACWEADVTLEGATGAFQRAVESARRAGSAELLAEAAIGSVLGADSVMELYAAHLRQEECRVLEEAFDALPSNQRALKHRVARTLATMCWAFGEITGATRWSSAAVAYVDAVDDPWAQLNVLAMECVHAIWAHEDRERAASTLARTEELVRDARLSVRERAEGTMLRMSFALHLGDGACFRSAMSELPDYLRQLPRPPRFGRLGVRHYIYSVLPTLMRMMRSTIEGDFAQAQSELGNAWKEANRHGFADTTHDRDFGLAMILPVLLYQGRTPLIAPMVEQHKQAVGPLGYHAYAALAALDGSDRGLAGSHFDTLRSLGFGLTRDAKPLLRHLVLMADLCTAVGTVSDAAVLHAALLHSRNFCVTDRLALSLGACARPLGELACQRGDHARGLDDFRYALCLNQELGHRPEIVRTRFGLARALAALGHEEEAHAELQLGQAEAERLGMRMPELARSHNVTKS